MRALRNLLGLGDGAAASASDSATVDEVVARLEGLPPERARFLAAFGGVLARVAHVDLELSEAEHDEIVSQLQQAGGLGADDARLVADVAAAQQAAVGGSEGYLVTRQLRAVADRAQRIVVLRCLFAVAAAEDGVSLVESNEITQIGIELGFTREEIAAVRGEWREHLAVLRAEPGRGRKK